MSILKEYGVRNSLSKLSVPYATRARACSKKKTHEGEVNRSGQLLYRRVVGTLRQNERRRESAVPKLSSTIVENEQAKRGQLDPQSLAFLP